MVSCLLNLKMAQWMCLWPGKMVSTFSHRKVCTSVIGYTILTFFMFTMPKLHWTCHSPILALSSTLLPVHNVTSFPLPSASRLSSLCLPFYPSLFPSFLPSPFLTSWFYFSPETHSFSENKMFFKFLDSHVLWEFGYWTIQAGLFTPLTFARHCLSPLAAFTSGACFLHNARRWQWICEFYTANVKGIFWGM